MPDLGWTCYERYCDEEMENAFAKARKLDANSIYVEVQIGGVRLYAGGYVDAHACWDKVISLDPKSSVGYVNRGVTHIYQEAFAAALTDLEAALSRDERDAIAINSLGWARVRQGKWEMAVADLNKAIGLQPQQLFSFIHRALARWRLGEHSAALEDLKSVLDIQLPKTTGGIMARLREDSVTWGGTTGDPWSKAVADGPNDFLPNLGRGICRWMAGNLEAAQYDLARARSIDPRSREVQSVLACVTAELAARTPAS
jgi:tetratricopeptide (TPR) repeat protein